MEIKELGHVVLYVHDIGRSTAFYRDLLGFRQIMGRSGGRFAAFSSGRSPSCSARPSGHCCS